MRDAKECKTQAKTLKSDKDIHTETQTLTIETK
jgi:hypothetical protein